MFKKNKKIDVDLAGNKFDVQDKDKYVLLEPIWSILENTPEDMKITSEELWKQSMVDPVIGNKLIQDLFQEFQGKVISNLLDLMFKPDEIIYSWVFDKMMLLVTRVDTGSNITLVDNPIMNGLKDKWREHRGL